MHPVALLVEDNADALDMYATFLASVGFRQLPAQSAVEGFTLALAERPDVIITDVRLPGKLDGLTFTTKLRLDVRTTHIPIIVLTGDAFAADRARALAAGCDVFLTKPCLPTVLADHARALIAA
jgi:two-component system cell cycle response regulator DivK